MITHLYHVEYMWNLERILNIIKSERDHAIEEGGKNITFPVQLNSEIEKDSFLSELNRKACIVTCCGQIAVGIIHTLVVL